MENLKAKLLNNIVKSKDDDYLKNSLLIAKAMGLKTEVQNSEGEELLFIKDTFSEAQFLPTIDMDQNMRILNWLCEHGTLTFSGEWATLSLENEVFRTHGGEGLFRQQLIVELAVLLSVFLNQ